MDNLSLSAETLEPIQTLNTAWHNFLSHWQDYAIRLLAAALMIFVGTLLLRLGRRLIRKHCGTAGKGASKRTPKQNKTIQSLATSIFNYIMYFAIAMITLSFLGVDVSSLLTLAGVSGIAVGFGSQTLVKDFISGMFLWGEGRLNVGDIVTVGGQTGVVEEIALRTTTLRDSGGYVYTIPNGDIRTVVNMSRDFRWAQVDLPISHGHDWDALTAALQDEMKLYAEKAGMQEVPQVIGLISSDRFSATVRIQVKCSVQDDWRLEREMRKAALSRLQKEGLLP